MIGEVLVCTQLVCQPLLVSNDELETVFLTLRVQQNTEDFLIRCSFGVVHLLTEIHKFRYLKRVWVALCNWVDALVLTATRSRRSRTWTMSSTSFSTMVTPKTPKSSSSTWKKPRSNWVSTASSAVDARRIMTQIWRCAQLVFSGFCSDVVRGVGFAHLLCIAR